MSRSTDEVCGQEDSGAGTQEVKGATRDIGSSANNEARRNIYSEAPTQTFDNPPSDGAYPSIFVPPTYSAPAQYQPAPFVPSQVNQRPTSRPVAGIGLPEKWAMILPYAPFYIGVVASLLELFLVPRRGCKRDFTRRKVSRCILRFWLCKRSLELSERSLTVLLVDLYLNWRRQSF